MTRALESRQPGADFNKVELQSLLIAALESSLTKTESAIPDWAVTTPKEEWRNDSPRGRDKESEPEDYVLTMWAADWSAEAGQALEEIHVTRDEFMKLKRALVRIRGLV